VWKLKYFWCILIQAVVFRKEGFKGLSVPLPAIIQVSACLIAILCRALILHICHKAPAYILGCTSPGTGLDQEYVDHGAYQYKFYIVGKKLFCSCRDSTPSAAALASANDNAHAMVFDRLIHHFSIM
jgi:hypothetical protein